jgi:Ca-activated chloride channel family protein
MWMHKIILLGLLLLPLGGDGVLEEANRLYEAGEYAQARAQYQEALPLYPEQASEIHYNLGSCLLAMDSTEKALSHFYRALSPHSPQTSSRAHNQIGILLAQRMQYEQALNQFQKAVRSDPTHLEASFNYELLKRIIADQQPPPAEEEKADEQSESEQDEQGEEKDEQSEEDASDPKEDAEEKDSPPEENQPQNPPQDASQPAHTDQAQPLQGDTLSLEQARLLLDRMRENEMRYMQQLRKTIRGGKKTDRPDW